MRHQKGNKKLGKPTDQRIALLRSLSSALITNKRIVTTDKRAKEASRYAEKLVGYAKEGSVHARRLALQMLPSKPVVKILFDDIGPHFKTRNGGYTRIVKAGFRKGDGAPVSVVEWLE